MLELRILSGLHRGATLPLNESTHTIGAGEEADVVLVDPGIALQHATLTKSDAGWLLSAQDGAVFTATSNLPHTEIMLTESDFARVGGVWLTIAHEGAGWQHPPPEPTASNAEEDRVDTSGNAGDTGLQERLPPRPGAAEADTAAVMEAATAAQIVIHKSKWQLMRLPMLFITVVSAAGIYAVTSNASKPASIPAAATPIAKHPPAAKRDPDAKQAVVQQAAAGPSEEELRVLFRKRLADAELLKRFDLDLQDQNWTMRATLDAEETARFERILAAFVDKYDIVFPVKATVGSGEAMLPFKIRQVISGANASVVTDEGYRLYEGDLYRGVRVLAIQGNRLTFVGKRKIEVQW